MANRLGFACIRSISFTLPFFIFHFHTMPAGPVIEGKRFFFAGKENPVFPLHSFTGRTT